MTRSGTAATLRAVLYSGFFSKREEFSRVETSSVNKLLEVGKLKVCLMYMITFVGLLELWL